MCSGATRSREICVASALAAAPVTRPCPDRRAAPRCCRRRLPDRRRHRAATGRVATYGPKSRFRNLREDWRASSQCRHRVGPRSRPQRSHKATRCADEKARESLRQGVCTTSSSAGACGGAENVGAKCRHSPTVRIALVDVLPCLAKLTRSGRTKVMSTDRIATIIYNGPRQPEE
jgi:hypothetical protein